MEEFNNLKTSLDVEEKLLKKIGDLRREIQNPAESLETDRQRVANLLGLLNKLIEVQRELYRDNK